MAFLSKKTVLLLLGVLLLLSIVVHYPLVEHERAQTDSYFIHRLSQSIVDSGYAKWTFHPLSYLGYYPFSYPSGVPFLLAEASSMTGLSVEVAILLSNMAFALLFCLGVFVLSRQFIRRSEYALLATFFAVLGPRLVDTLYWDGSARGPAVVLMTLLVFVSFRAASFKQNMLFVIAILLGFTCFVTHHMAVLLVLFGFGYVFAAFQSQYVMRRVGDMKRTVAMVETAALTAAIALTAFAYLGFFQDLVSMNLHKSPLFAVDPPALSVFLNLAVIYINQIGFILVIAVLAIPSILRNSRLSTETFFPLATLLAFIPLLGNSLYVSMLLTPFVAILGVFWLARMYERNKRKTHALLVLGFLMGASLILPLWSSQRWNSDAYLSGDMVETDNRMFSDASYLGSNARGLFAISNTNTMSLELSATSGVDFLGSGLFLALNGDITPRDVHNNITWSTAGFPTNLYVWFEYQNEPNADRYVLGLMMLGLTYTSGQRSYSDARDYFSSHPKLLVVVDNNRPSNFIDPYSILPAAFLAQVRNAQWQPDPAHPAVYSPLPSYAIYQSQRVSMFAVEMPP